MTLTVRRVAGRSVGLTVALAIGLGLLVGPSASAGPTGVPAGQVSGVAAVAAGPLPTPQQSPEESRQRAQEILDRPEFRAAAPSIYDRALRWLGQRLGDLITGLLSGGAGAAVAWGVLALVAGLVVFLATRLIRTVQAEPTRAGSAVEVELRRPPTEWRREAEAHEARGEWKEALRCRYRALIGDLIARDVVRDLPGRTTGEYRADVNGQLPTAGPDFAGASELFERAWYGDRATGPDENARFRELADHVVAEAGRRSHGRSAGSELESVPA